MGACGFHYHHFVTAFRRLSIALCLNLAVLTTAYAQDGDAIDEMFSKLAEPEGEGWRIAETDILREWSKSGSAAMDMLLQRGEGALDIGDPESAIGHLTALTDHAPDFATGWQARAAAFAMLGQTGPAIEDLRRALQLEPRHFVALTQLGALLEEMGDTHRALAAYRASLKIHPYQQEALDAVARLERETSGTRI